VGPGRELLLEVQQETGPDADLGLVAVANDQLLLTPAAESFVQRGRELATAPRSAPPWSARRWWWPLAPLVMVFGLCSVGFTVGFIAHHARIELARRNPSDSLHVREISCRAGEI
jgi:hypothetical protein